MSLFILNWNFLLCSILVSFVFRLVHFKDHSGWRGSDYNFTCEVQHHSSFLFKSSFLSFVLDFLGLLQGSFFLLVDDNLISFSFMDFQNFFKLLSKFINWWMILWNLAGEFIAIYCLILFIYFSIPIMRERCHETWLYEPVVLLLIWIQIKPYSFSNLVSFLNSEV